VYAYSGLEPNPNKRKKSYSKQWVADQLGVSLQTVYSMIKKGKLETEGKRVTQSSYENYVRVQETRPPKKKQSARSAKESKDAAPKEQGKESIPQKPTETTAVPDAEAVVRELLEMEQSDQESVSTDKKSEVDLAMIKMAVKYGYMKGRLDLYESLSEFKRRTA